MSFGASTAILREVAEKHAASPLDLVGPYADRSLKAARIEAVTRMRAQGMSWRAIGRKLNVNERLCRYLVDTHSAEKNCPHPVSEVRALARRLSHQDTATLLMSECAQLKLLLWQARGLAILVDRYPNVLSSDQWCEAYDMACELTGHAGKPVDDVMVRQFTTKTRKAFRAQGLSNPIVTIERVGLHLSHEAATWLHHAIGRPRVLKGAV